MKSSMMWKKKNGQEPEVKPSFFTARNTDQNGTEVEASSAFSWGKKQERPPATTGLSFPWSKKQQTATVPPPPPPPPPVPVAPATTGLSFPWSKKKQQTAAVPPPPPPPPPVPEAPATTGLSFPWSKKKQEIAAVPPPPPVPVAPATPPRSSKFSFMKQSTNSSPSSRSIATAPPTPSPPRKNKSKRDNVPIYKEKRSRTCCSCKCLIGSACLLILLVVGGVLAWRYGPWFQSSYESIDLSVQSCPDCCNGSRSNCKLPVNKVLFPTLHNAHSSKDHKFIAPSHDKQFEDALVAGYRGLQFSTCTCENVLSLSNNLLERDSDLGLENSNLGFCNAACAAGVRDPGAVIMNLKKFLDTNRREVLIVDIDMNDDSEDDLRRALRASGLLDYVWIPGSEYVSWPKMRKLVDSNKRLILFGRGGTMRSCDANECRDGILYFYDFFAQTDPDGNDVTSCDATLSGEIYVDYLLLNQFHNNAAMIPSAAVAKDLNSFNTLSARFDECQGKVLPSLLSVEFWQEGDVLEFAQKENEKREELMNMGFGLRR